MVKELTITQNVVRETKNEIPYSSAVCAFNRKNAVDEMNNCVIEMMKNRFFVSFAEMIDWKRFFEVACPSV